LSDDGLAVFRLSYAVGISIFLWIHSTSNICSRNSDAVSIVCGIKRRPGDRYSYDKKVAGMGEMDAESSRCIISNIRIRRYDNLLVISCCYILEMRGK
jgi:hypothetical protein